ncbi:FAD linked oxidase domain protein [Aspergillus nanangensis]|uniref:FAD linked oxidase domain protein n=1 Tax=Aspergillus nanangensis TaxID=2582783 RepID=A0AAD4CGZ3_ASPNN|nr:FAD linked oxidase domain protein [Aspergillus nanangensis]
MYPWNFRTISRSDPEYESARRAAVWNGRVPDRYPELIAFPETDEDVQNLVRYAKEKKLSIGTKSGGHSWTASFLRDSGILVNLEKMNDISVNVKDCTATVQPAAYGSDLNVVLHQHDLMFPGGHCSTVGLGGYLLQGGFGWNSRKWGVACESVLAIDVVTANGTLIHANATDNKEYYWAARGSGCGYFGLITRFYVKVYSLPRGIMTSRYVFEVKDLDQAIAAMDAASNQVSPDLELVLFIGRDQDGIEGRPTFAIVGDALSETDAEALTALSLLHDLPIMKKAVKSRPFVSCTLPEVLKRYDNILDNRGLRYETNNMWTDVPTTQLLPNIHEIIKSLPPAPSHLYIVWWLPTRGRPDMAFSMEGRLFMSLYAISNDPSMDERNARFVVSSFQKLDNCRKGIQLADENLPGHPGKFMQTSNYRRLEALRRKHDPEGRFWGYMRVPPEFDEALHVL